MLARAGGGKVVAVGASWSPGLAKRWGFICDRIFTHRNDFRPRRASPVDSRTASRAPVC